MAGATTSHQGGPVRGVWRDGMSFLRHNPRKVTALT